MFYLVIAKNTEYIKLFNKLRKARYYLHMLPPYQTPIILRMSDGKVMYKSYGYKKKFCNRGKEV